MATLYLTPKVKAKFEAVHGEKEINYDEGFGNVLMMLALSDSHLVELAVNLVKAWGLDKGGTRLQDEHNL